MDIGKDVIDSVKKGLSIKTIITTAVTVTVISVTTKFAKAGKFGTRVAALTNKYIA